LFLPRFPQDKPLEFGKTLSIKDEGNLQERVLERYGTGHPDGLRDRPQKKKKQKKTQGKDQRATHRILPKSRTEVRLGEFILATLGGSKELNRTVVKRRGVRESTRVHCKRTTRSDTVTQPGAARTQQWNTDTLR